jgi:hypothetical protein
MKTKTSLIRNSTSRPSRFSTIKLRRHTDLRAALIRIWLTAGITACLAAPAAKAAGTISATPNPVVYVTKPKPTPFLLGKQGETTITWDSGAANPYADVWVSVDGGAETLFSSAHKGSKATTIGFGKTHTFKLYSSSKVYLGASVSVTTKYYPFIENIKRDPNGTFAKIRFDTKEGSLPVVSVSTKLPLSFPLVSSKDEKMWSKPSDIAYSTFAQTGTKHEAQLNTLKPSKPYWYVISAHDKKSGLWFKIPGAFMTLKRMVTVNFRKLWITDDSDGGSAGDLRFGFYINGQPVAKYPSGSGYASLDTDDQKTINRTVGFASAAPTLTLKATGFDNDVGFGGLDSTGANFPAGDPNLGTGEGKNGEWTSTSKTINVDNTDPVETVGPIFFKLVAKGAHDSDLEFEVHGEYKISYAP